MQVKESSKISGLRIITPVVFHDFRGEFVETFNARDYAFTDGAGEPIEFLEDDISVSRYKVLHGMHGDLVTWKLVQCIVGEVYLVVADLRADSATYLNWEAFAINEKNRTQILIPAGCVNGHLCLSDKSVFAYKQSQIYSGAEKQISAKWNDPKLNIYWPVADPILSARDQFAKLL
jgi:dTDP-4-dehydrorhamnose 3,5-epimerase